MLFRSTGDWVESCTAVAESHDGTFEVIVWQTHGQAAMPEDTEEPEALVAA